MRPARQQDRAPGKKPGDPYERAYALGPIFRKVSWHSVAAAAVIGLIALPQAYVFPGSIPIAPAKWATAQLHCSS